MDLLFVTREPFPTYRGPIWSVFGRYMPRFGVKTCIVATADEEHFSRKEWEGGKLLLSKRRSSRTLNQICSFFHDAWTLLFGLNGYSAVQIRDKIVSAVLCLLTARCAGIPFIYYMSFPYPEDDLARVKIQGMSLRRGRLLYTRLRGQVTKWLLYRLVLRYADGIIVLSDRMKKEVVFRGAPEERITVVPTGVDMEALAAMQSFEGSVIQRLRSVRVLVYIGLMNKTRRIDFLFEVLTLVRQEAEDTVLLLIGDANEAADREWLEKRAREIGVDDAVVWTGWLPQMEALSLARMGHVALSAIPLTWIYDISSPIKPQEYLALGLPVVATAIPDQVKVLEESGGGIIAGFTPREFADAVLKLLRDPQTASEMGRRGREYIRTNRSYELIARQLADKYRELLKEKGKRIA